MAEEHRYFTFIPVLSDPFAVRSWSLARPGFVAQAVMADFPDLSGYQVYAVRGRR